jgi:IclR family acetate operon transcriptional repressor
MPYMVALRDEVDETVGLHELLPSGDRVVVDQVESRQELRRHYTDIGIPIQLPHGAPGKAILSVLPWERQARVPETPIAAVTSRTVTDPDRLADELAVARERGYAGSDSERTPGIRAVAAPVFDHTGSVIGAIGPSVPEVRMGDERAAELGRRAAEVAWEISEALGASRELVDTTIARASAPAA